MMKHIKNIARILFWAIIEIPVVILGLFVVPIALLFEREVHSGELRNPVDMLFNFRLPKWAIYWDNGDEGTCGDKYWRTEHHPDDFDSFKAKFIWLAIRNPAFEWSKRFGGINGVAVEKRVWGKTWGPHQGNPPNEIMVDNHPDTQGMAYRELDMSDGKTLAQYSFCWMYPFKVKGKSYGFRFQIGPFIQAVQQVDIDEGNPVEFGHSVLIQPFKQFK